MTKRTSYNERAWAVDLISEINRLSASHARCIQCASGEWGVSSSDGDRVLFPDVLLFGDPTRGAALQGWELKMPDTPVTDETLLRNAQEKARRLGLTSFLVWNAIEAVLYHLEAENRSVVKTWRCEGIATRADVELKRAEWVETLAAIVNDLNDYFERGELSSTKPLPSQLNDVVTVILEDYSGSLASHLLKEEKRSREWRAEVSVWWRGVKSEHGNPKDDVHFSILAKEILLHWIHRFLFAHYLKRFFAEAGRIDDINEESTVQDAEAIFQTISAKRDFAQVFLPRSGAARLPVHVWRVLLSFNGFLKAVRLPSIDQKLFQETLRSVRHESQRKIAGQFCTPPPLADLLVKLTIDDLNAPVLDPCCGTGTIARAVFDFKVKSGIKSTEAVKTTWASDRYAMPLQFATLALASGDAPFETLRIFKHDVTTLKSGEVISFVDAKDGKRISLALPTFPCVVLNPPFVRFEDWMNNDTSIVEINKFVTSTTSEKIDPKADYFVPIILHLWRLCAVGARVGAIFPNSWLGADWGLAFRRILRKLFKIEAVITSGAGRWFPNADVVANLVVLKKRYCVGKASADELTVFGVTLHPLSDWTDDSTTLIADSVVISLAPSNDFLRTNRIKASELAHFDEAGLCWSAHFSSLNWFTNVEPSLVSVASFFDVNRGERRGWDALFFPADDVKIERDYLHPVLKSAVDAQRFLTKAGGKAFCCSVAVEELEEKGHLGALSWIKKFQFAKNKKGVALTKSLARSGLRWYEMRPDTKADLAVSMNPNKRLFFMRLKPRAFVNQRLIRLTAKNGSVDVELSHALLCSLIGCFYLEALGFGRGLGVLDLNSNKLSRQMLMLNPSKVSKENRDKILSAFGVMQKRNVRTLEEELKSADRMEFEEAVFGSFRLLSILPLVQESVLELHRIRGAACKQKKTEKKS